jgi:two-component system alkaline phosphatase synthesis response regulator PhoP
MAIGIEDTMLDQVSKQISPGRVLIADDDESTRYLVSTLVEQYEYKPVMAKDGRETYRILRTDADFRAAIIDMTMPFLNGLDLIRYMRSERRLMRIPVMLISGEQDLKLANASFEAGAAAFLTKPFTPAQLQAAIRMLLGSGTLSRGRPCKPQPRLSNYQ